MWGGIVRFNREIDLPHSIVAKQEKNDILNKEVNIFYLKWEEGGGGGELSNLHLPWYYKYKMLVIIQPD